MQLQSDRGAVLIHVLIAFVLLLLLSGFVVDYGALWVARAQAQNSADAAALAGSVALATDVPHAGSDRWDRARNVAWNTGHVNRVWGMSPSAVIVTSPYNGNPCTSRPERCVRVEVRRTGIPTWFMQLAGIQSQGARAVAVAQTNPATGTNCMKPWLVPDRYTDTNRNGKPDFGEYMGPTRTTEGAINYGTGWTPADIGQTIALKPGNPNQAISPSDYFEIDDPDFGVVGGAAYRNAISTCVIRRNVGDTVSTLPGNRKGPTKQGFDDLISLSGGAATIIVGLFDPVAFETQKRQSGNFPITITNMLAFKVTTNSMSNNGTITATIAGAPSQQMTTCRTTPCPTTSGLVSVIQLIR